MIPLFILEFILLFASGILMGVLKIRGDIMIDLSAVLLLLAILIDPLMSDAFFTHPYYFMAGNIMGLAFFLEGWLLAEPRAPMPEEMKEAIEELSEIDEKIEDKDKNKKKYQEICRKVENENEPEKD